MRGTAAEAGDLAFVYNITHLLANARGGAKVFLPWILHYRDMALTHG